MTSQASVSFTGISNIRQLRFPFTRGVLPSTGTIYCAATPNTLDAGGELRLSFGGNTVVFQDCAVSSCHLVRHHDGGHPIFMVAFKDRRWKWKNSSVSGNWNRRLADGTIDPITQITPAGMAQQILNAMGEGNYDTSRMPGGVYPPGKWDNTRADIALQRLCDYVACEVVLNPSTNAVEIWPLGVGSSTNTGAGELYPKYRHIPRATAPSSIRVNCGPSVWQSKLQLTAVAINNSNGQERTLSTWEGMPTGGISTESIMSFPNISNANLRYVAFDEYLKLFHVTGQQDGSLAVPNCPLAITSTEQYVLNDYRLEALTDGWGFKKNLPAYIDGDYWAYSETAENVTSQLYTGEFTIIPERRSVQFPYPMIKLSSTGAYGTPTLYITTSYRVKDVYGQLAGLYRYGAANGGGGQMVLSRPEIFSAYSSSVNTEAQAVAEADNYIAMFQQKYSNPLCSEITYPGLLSGSLDGNIAQITWEYSVNYLPRTIAFEGDDLDIAALSSAERRRILATEDR